MTRYNYNTDQSERVCVNHTTILLLLKSFCEMSTQTCITDVSGCRGVNSTLVVEIIGIMSKSPTNKIALRTFIEVTYNDVSQLTPELVMVDFMN